MKKLQTALLSAILSFALISTAEAAHHNSVNGLIIGAGSGALIGQSIGGDTESTVAGTVVGGLVGYMIGNSIDHPSATYAHHRPPRRVIHHYRPAHTYKRKHYRSRTHYRGSDKVFRKTVKIKEKHGGRKKVITKTYWYDSPKYRYRDRSYSHRDRSYYHRDRNRIHRDRQVNWDRKWSRDF